MWKWSKEKTIYGKNGFFSGDYVKINELVGDYMILVSRDEILSRFAGIPAVL